jgi:hypothetical protein
MPFYEGASPLSELRTRWQWAPLRSDPRMQKILAGPEPRRVLERRRRWPGVSSAIRYGHGVRAI